MSALLALSASHLAWQTNNRDTDNLAQYHRGVALKGLHEAIGRFSRDNSEPILAASIMLSWQSTEWRGWASLQQGISTVLSAMRPWLRESVLAGYIEEQRAGARSRRPANTTLSPSEGVIPHEDRRRLEQVMTAVHKLRLRLPKSGELVEHAGHLSDHLQDLQQNLHLQASAEAFARLQPLRHLVFWLPTHILRSAESDLAPLALLSHLYASALATEPLFPEVGGTYLGSLAVAPLENIHETLRARRLTQPHDTGVQVALSLMDVPLQIMVSYRLRQWPNNDSDPAVGLYRYSPQGSPFIAPLVLLPSSTSDSPTPSLCTNSLLHGPSSGLSIPSSTYFQAALGPSGLRRQSSFPSIGRAHSWSETRLDSGSPQAMGMMYGSTALQQPRSSHELSGSKTDYFGEIAAPYNAYGRVDTNVRFVTP
ncbi:hypothetical protein A1O3_00598 [Capronia epimyces CBS 606.96]|uniref:Uncharacterized protein n=1 Tax=Capronia epimyces CBS 606.96 TaxID=1182542 RepID=W9YHM6_9EURO|nr:uncharacterized protein A1O3_00598 [Capronia epimyces CBS 606.96]EXJ92048.1 hypothetical protein A1O3_00598 [Capronia epimyces CBS 606.96]